MIVAFAGCLMIRHRTKKLVHGAHQIPAVMAILSTPLAAINIKLKPIGMLQICPFIATI
jgi:hypothetical protein